MRIHDSVEAHLDPMNREKLLQGWCKRRLVCKRTMAQRRNCSEWSGVQLAYTFMGSLRDAEGIPACWSRLLQG